MKTLLALLATVMVVGLTACSTSEPGVENTLGTVSTEVQAEPPQVTKAAEAVLKDLDLVRVSSTSTDVDGKAFGYTASDKKVTVSIERLGENLTEVSVRSGFWGDEDLGVAIITQIEEQLGVAPEK